MSSSDRAVAADPAIPAAAVARNVARAPLAAEVLERLLRFGAGQPSAVALEQESACYALLQGSAEHAGWLRDRPPVAAGPAGHVHMTRRGARLEILLDRPAAHNAIDRTMRDGLYEAFSVAAIDPEIRTVRLGAVGRTFSVGGDLAEFGTTRDPATAHLIRARTLPAIPLVACADRVRVHVRGGCVGAGLEIAAFAGRFTAAPAAWFQLPEIAMGLIPGAGGTVSVPRRIGVERAALLILSGRRISAATALRWGLIDAIEDAQPGDEGGADANGGEIAARA